MDWNKYQVGGEYYNALRDQYGLDSADYVAGVATGQNETALRNALSAVRSTVRQGTGTAATWDASLNNNSTSTFEIFASQIVNDPLAAPLDSLNNQLSKAVGNVFKNPMVLLLVIVAGIGLLGYFGGWKKLVGKLA